MLKIIKKIFSFLFMDKKKKLPTYIVENAETFAVSLVEHPAIEEEFLLFNKQDENDKQILKFADDEKHLLVGAVMVPDKPIYRIGENGEEYNLVFSKEAIEGMAIDFMKNFRQYNVTLQHEENATGVWLTEQWIKSDMNNDKSIAIGLNKDLPVGTLFQSYYCDSNELWAKLKSGEMRGFSIEAICDFAKIEKQFKDEKVEEENNNENNDNIMPIRMEEMSEQTTQTVVEEAAPTVETPVVEQPVVEETKIEEKVEQPTEEVVDENAQEPVSHAQVDNDVLQNLLEEIKSLREQNSELVDKVKELNVQPSAKPLNTNAKPSASSNYSNWRKELAKML